MLIGAAVVLTGCNSDVEKTSMSMNGECVLMATATEADINLENYLTPVLQLAWQSPQWYSNDDTRNSTFNNLPAYIQTASEPGFGNIIESAISTANTPMIILVPVDMLREPPSSFSGFFAISPKPAFWSVLN